LHVRFVIYQQQFAHWAHTIAERLR